MELVWIECCLPDWVKKKMVLRFGICEQKEDALFPNPLRIDPPSRKMRERLYEE